MSTAIRLEPVTDVIRDLFGVPHLEPLTPAAPLSWSEAYQRIDELEEQVLETQRAARLLIAQHQQETRELHEQLRAAQGYFTDMEDAASKARSHIMGR